MARAVLWLVPFACTLVLWAGSVLAYLYSDSVAAFDARVADRLYAVHDDRLIGLFGRITTLGGWQVVAALLGGTSIALLILRRRDLATGLWIVVVGNQVTVTALKALFGRARPALAHFVETSGSFPSGHAATSVGIWGMLLYLAWRTRLLSGNASAVSAIVIALSIGASRVYLLEHYVSDVLNGYLVGALWLMLGVAFCERHRNDRFAEPVPDVRALRLALASLAAGVAAAAWIAATLVMPVAVPG